MLVKSDRNHARRPVRRQMLRITRPDRTPHRVCAALVILMLVAAPFASIPVFPGASPVSAAPDAARGAGQDESASSALLSTSGKIKLPFRGGEVWTFGQGYNTSPAEGGSHWNCDPTTLKDQPSQTQGCRAPYQYRFSIDLYMADGSTAGRALLSPVNGVIRWIDQSTGGLSIDLGDGYAVAFFHTDLFAGLAAGQTVRQGQQLAVVSPPGGGANGGWPHVHLTVWQTTDGGNWSRNAIPFTGANALEGVDFPDLGASVRNQHRNRTLTSSNSPTGAPTGPVPSAPTLNAPASGSVIPSSTPTPTLRWNAVTGASEYQVTLNDGAIVSPWVTGTSWTTASLASGQYSWRVKARNANGTGANSAAWTFTVSGSTDSPPSGTAALALGASSGSVASTLAISGTGYGANEDVRIYWNATTVSPLTTIRASSSGAISGSIVVPNATRATHTIIARGVTSGRTAQQPFSVTSSLARTPTEGVPGSRIAVTVRGFGPNEQVRLTWDSGTGATLATATTNGGGTGTVNIAVPDGGAGWHDYSGLGLTSGYRAWGAINVLSNLTANPVNGAPGTNVQVNLRGFPASRAVTLAWNKTATSAGQSLCSGTSSAVGAYACSFAIPVGSSGTVPLVAAASDGTSRTASITVGSASGPVQGGTILGPGAFRVTGTREGLVGGTTSSGHVIVPDDHFVSLPSCTSSSCPWLASGADHSTWGVRTECGQFCYVRVTNPITNACSVAPVLDVGPWFRVDDWWNPTNARNLNRRAANPNDLVQGYTGVDAARNGLDVGYGRSANGIGITDKGVETGNRSAIDLGDGVWADLGFAYNDLMRPDGIVVTFLWQTGESASAAAQACGTNLPGTGGPSPSPTPSRTPTATPTRTPTPSPSATPRPSVRLQVAPASGRVGGSINVTGSGFRPGETVNIYWDSTNASPRAGVIVDGRGDVDATFSVYSNPIGAHRLIARGVDSGRGAETTFVVIPTITSTSAEALPGSSVELVVRGFAAGEVVNLTWDTASGASLGAVTVDTKGNARPTVALPRGSGGIHTIVGTGASSGGGASATVRLSSTFTLGPSQGTVGTRVTAMIGGFPAASSYAIYWNRMGSVGTGTSVCGGTTSSSGTGTCSFNVPTSAVSGATYPVVAVSGSASRQLSFVVAGAGVQTASATASPAQAASGQRIDVIVAGFQPGESVSVFWDSRTSAGGTRTADSSGRATISSTVLTGTFGTHTITVRGATSGRVATTYFTIIPTVSISPDGGGARTRVTLTGKGFDPRSAVGFYWNRTGNSGGVLLCTASATSAGTATCAGNVPNSVATGAYPIVAVSGAKSATVTFNVGTMFAAAIEADTASPTPTTTEDGTPTASAEATNTPESTPNSESSATATGSPTAEITPSTTVETTPTVTPSGTPIPTETSLATEEPSPTGDVAPTESPVSIDTATPMEPPVPTQTAIPSETSAPTETPVSTETAVPTETPRPTETPVPTEAPVPTETPTEIPTQAPPPEPVRRELVLYPLADTSVTSLTPDAPQDPATIGTLTAGGPDTAITYVTFAVAGVAPGSVIDARLVVTGAGNVGAVGGAVGVLPGVPIDEWAMTHTAAASFQAAPAYGLDGAPAYIAWQDPWVETWIDVSGVVTADGTVTFVLSGAPDAALTLASRESATPPRLVLTILDPVAATAP